MSRPGVPPGAASLPVPRSQLGRYAGHGLGGQGGASTGQPEHVLPAELLGLQSDNTSETTARAAVSRGKRLSAFPRVEEDSSERISAGRYDMMFGGMGATSGTDAAASHEEAVDDVDDQLYFYGAPGVLSGSVGGNGGVNISAADSDAAAEDGADDYYAPLAADAGAADLALGSGLASLLNGLAMDPTSLPQFDGQTTHSRADADTPLSASATYMAGSTGSGGGFASGLSPLAAEFSFSGGVGSTISRVEEHTDGAADAADAEDTNSDRADEDSVHGPLAEPDWADAEEAELQHEESPSSLQRLVVGSVGPVGPAVVHKAASTSAAPAKGVSYATRALRVAATGGGQGQAGASHGVAPTAQHFDDRKPCAFFLLGNCKYGTRCRHAHNFGPSCRCPNCQLVFPADDLLQQQHLRECDEVRLAAEERKASEDLVCGVCYEPIIASGRRFGLLQTCNHPFCLECIRKWRASESTVKETVRACPLCRAESYFVTPCDRMILDAARKEVVVLRYKEQMNRIPCTYFAQSKGACPFGSSCFYAHLNPDGSRAESEAVRLRTSADGELEVVRKVTLSDFIKRRR